MFLFGEARHSRQPYTTGDRLEGLSWKTFLNSYPPSGAESTAVFDSCGNLYFGSHNGNFYSLDARGRVRWTFSTKEKIYGSPLIHDDAVYFCGGDGYFYSLGLNGSLRWAFDLSKGYRGFRGKALFYRFLHLPFTFNRTLKRVILVNSWCSPNKIGDVLLVTGYGKGLFCVASDGVKKWDFDLGFPRNQLAGVAVDHQINVYCSSRSGYVFCLSSDGRVIWRQMCCLYGEPWGNPVVSREADRVMFFYSRHEREGSVVAYSLKGRRMWAFSCGPIRGSAAVSLDSKSIYICDFSGYLRQLSLDDGRELRKVKVSLTGVPRSLWTTPTLDSAGSVLLSVKDGPRCGRIIKFSQELEIFWQYKTNKVLSVPLVGSSGEVYFGAWDGYYYCLKTK